MLNNFSNSLKLLILEQQNKRLANKMAMWIIILGVVILIIGILLLAVTSNGLKPVYFLPILVIASGLFTLFKDLSSSEKQENLFKKQAEKIDSLSIENQALHGELRESNNFIIENIKGGQEPAYLEIQFRGNNIYECYLKNENVYSIFSLITEITNYDKVINCASVIENEKTIFDEACFLANSKDFKLDELSVGYYILNNSVSGLTDVNIKDYGRYQVRFRSRNKLFYQQLVYKKVSKKIYTTSRILEKGLLDNGEEQPRIVKIIEPALSGWTVNFDREFPTGIIQNMKNL